MLQDSCDLNILSHCVKSVQIHSFFWSLSSCIWTEYGEILRISLYSVRMRENTDQKNCIWTLFTQWSLFQTKILEAINYIRNIIKQRPDVDTI